MNERKRALWVLSAMACLIVLWTTQVGQALVISEIMYHPVEADGTPDGDENLEFIELYNDRAVVEDLSNYAFTKGINFRFLPGTTLGAKEYVVVARDPGEVQSAYGITGVYGPFTSGKLDNDGERIELSTNAGEIIISLRYKDTWPWPNSPDGTGHSLTLAKLGGDPEEASSWAASKYIGGTPGGPEVSEVVGGEPTELDLINVGHPGRFFKGYEEPSPGGGGEATIAWAQIGFNDDPGTTDWIDGASGYGYSDEDNERQWIRTELTDMRGGYISVYSRLDFELTPAQISSLTSLQAEVHYDDGYVLYLNGVRVGASDDIDGNPPAFSASGGPSSDPPADYINLTEYIGLLVPGTNVLAMQAHNSSLSSSSDCVSSVILTAVAEDIVDENPTARLLINELLTNSDSGSGNDWLEIYNPGPVAVDLSNVYVSEGRFELLRFKLPAVVLEPGEFYSVEQGTPPSGFDFGLGFAGETVFLTLASDGVVPAAIRVLDAVRFGFVEPDVTLGRYPDGAANFEALSYPTRNTANSQPWIRDVVINEIMYHHGSRDERYEYVELYNKSAHPIPLEGWAFTDGISYDFNDTSQVTEIPAGGYLVVAKDPSLLETVYDNLTIGVNLCGPYNGELDDHSERLRLSLPIEDTDPCTGLPATYYVTADEVTYYDGGRWPSWADGMGTSMELRDPRSNNNTPDAWADSDESDKAEWEPFSYTIYTSDPKYTHDAVTVFDMMMLNRGEILLDNLQLVAAGTSRLANGNFENGASSWQMLGNHTRSYITTDEAYAGSAALHVIATGHGDPGANRINQGFPIANGGNVTFIGWAKWLRGSKHLLMRVSRERSPIQPPRPAYSYELTMPMNLGTPGLQNTAYVSNRGPEIVDVKHSPVLPAGGEQIVVTARVTDNDGVGAVTLYYRTEGTGGFVPAAMTDNGSGNDYISGDKIYTGTIPATSGGAMRAFYIEASDGSTSTRFPTMLGPTAEAPVRTCLVRVGDAVVNSEFANYRIWLSNDVISAFTSRPNLSNELVDCTFVYNNTEVFYNAHIRFRGSPFLRSGFGRNPTSTERYAYRLEFNPDQRYRSREEINLDNTEGGNRGPLQERASYWFYRQMGLQYSMQEYVRPVINGVNHYAYEDVQKIDGEYVKAWFPSNNDGYIHKIDDYFEYSIGGTEHTELDEGLKYDSDHPLIPETYRWGFEKRSHRENDEWDHLLNFAEKMNTPPTDPGYEDAIESVIHPQHFLAVLGLRHAVGDWDSYGYTRGKNNMFYYALPEGKWYLLPWDIDFTLGSGDGSSTSLFSMDSSEFPEVFRFLNTPKYRDMYLQFFAVLVNGPWQSSYGTSDPPTAFDKFLDDAADALVADGAGDGRRNEIKAYVRDRRLYILPQVPALKFEILSRLSHIYTTGTVITLKGTAPPYVSGISANGEPILSEFGENNAFTVNIPISLGTHYITLQALDGAGSPIAGLSDSIWITRTRGCSITDVPDTMCNSGTGTLILRGENFDAGCEATVALTSISDEIGFDALYVPYGQGFDRINAATLLLDDPGRGIDDPTYAVHPVINLWNSGARGEFTNNETNFASPFNIGADNFAVRFTGYIYAPSAGVRHFGVSSDEGFTLSIDGQLVGEYADIRTAATTDPTQNKTDGTMAFNFPAEGYYHLILDYFENSDGEEIELFQTNSTGGDRHLINVDSELVVYRDDAARTIHATNVVVTDTNTITCQINVRGAAEDVWNIVATPTCGEPTRFDLYDVIELIPCSGDLNHDCKVDFGDWGEFGEYWDRTCSAPDWCDGADMDFSTTIDAVDLELLAQQWLLPN
ncbi:MAG: lamin tail domain-containing protein [Sedimentisphaerales bacterium]|nr:lamin tail domain-containing protein [Sedimentisphaerales bacterium]